MPPWLSFVPPGNTGYIACQKRTAKASGSMMSDISDCRKIQELLRAASADCSMVSTANRGARCGNPYSTPAD